MKRPFEIPPSLFPYQSHWCMVDGIPVHYIDEGKGPVLLLIHGNFMWSFSYRRLIEALCKSYRCISIDLAGMGMSGKPHELGRHEFQYTYREQSHVVENVVATLNLRDVTFLSFDHGGPIGFNVMTRLPERFSRIIIANSWAWSCHAYPATRIWSMVAPLSKHALRKLMLNKKRWLFETSKDLKNPEVWNACINPYRNARDFAPIAKMAQQLTRAKSYFEELDSKMYTLANKEVDIVWTTKSGGLFPEFVKEEMFLSRWRDIFPNASMNLVADLGYYGLITCPSRTLVNTILRAV